MKQRTLTYIATTVALTGLLFGASGGSIVLAAVMESGSYKIQIDSVNVGGREDSSSASYGLRTTIGEVATGESESASYKIKAGYRQMEGGSISISAPSDVVLTNLSITQNSAVGNAVWTVITDNSAGYVLTVNASASNALVDSGTSEEFTDYTEGAPGVKETWAVSNAYEFGFSGLGNDTTGYGSDADCIAGADVPSVGLLWEGFSGTTPIELASSSARTSPTGTNTTICVATTQDTVFAPSGSYEASLTATATVQ